MNIKSAIVFAVGLFIGFASFAAPGDCWKNATALSAGKSKTVSLVDEYDPEWKETTGNAAYYLKITCSKGNAYTVIVQGAEDVSFSIDDEGNYKDKGEEWFAPCFDVESDVRAILYEDSWEDENPSSVTYYIYVSGSEIGDSATVSFMQGEQPEPVVYGTEENPKSITVGTSITSTSGELIDGSYYFVAKLEAGRKYKFYTSGGTEDAPLSLEAYVRPSEEELSEPELKDVDVGEYDKGYIVKPLSSGEHIILIGGLEESQSFTLNYGGVPARLPTAHDFANLGAISASGATTEIELGHRNDPESGFFDNVIDQSLVKVTLAAGAMYHFKTEGATVNAIMEVYDAKGNVLLTNRGGIDTNDCALTFKPTVNGDYYVGVCEDLEDDEADEPKFETVTFSAKLVTLADGFSDGWDPEDDTYLGSTGLAPAIGTKDSKVFEDGASAGSHTLGVGDLEDWFRIDARKGLSYKFGAVLDESADSAETLVLQAKVYTLKSGKLTEVVVTSEDNDLTKGLSFTATASISYYIQVTVRDGQGIDFGPYEFKSLAYDAGGAKLGTLSVNIGGATFAEGAVWWLGSEKTVTYPGGASVLLAEGSYTVNFATVKNWTAPTAQATKVVFGTPALVDVKYSDTADHKDDVIAGATKLTPAAKEATVSRSLWKDDPADWFSFAVKPSGYYTFKLEPSARLGDARIFVYANDKKTLVAEGTTVSFLCRDSKGDYYVKVAHSDSPAADAQYVMTYSVAQVGAVGFAKTAMSVKDSATSVALTVNRATGKEGRVRVRYSTFAGTAEPGKNYINQSGVLEWEANDAKAKTITVVLLGDLVSVWKEDLDFTVQLAALDPADVTADEYVPLLGNATATVTVSAATKKATGTVRFSGFGEMNEPIADVKKPAATVLSGEKAYFWLERTDGSDGTIGVTITPTKGKALPDVNYVDEPQTLVWTNGETAAKCFVLETLVEDVELQGAKALTLKLTADKTYADTAKLGATATLTVSDSKVSGTVEEYAATFAKPDGIAVKQAKADTWYFDAAGTFRSITPAAGNKVELTVTLTGPGKFAFTPTFVNTGLAANAATCTFGKEVVPMSPGAEIVRYVAKGTTTVKFAVSRDKNDKSDDTSCYLTLVSGKADGTPFAWKQLLAPTLVAPLAGSIVDPLVDNHIEWTSVDEAKDGDVIYRVWFLPAAQKKDLGKGEPVNLEDPYATSYCTGCGMVTPGANESWVCRVDSAFIDESGEMVLTNVNTAVWTYQTMGEKAPRAKIAGGTDVDGSEIASLTKVGNAYPVKLMQGVFAEIKLGTDAAGKVTYALASGSKLPDGLKLDANKGVISGVPSKVGEYQAVVALKGGIASAGTEAFVFTVEDCGLAAGTFNGLVSSDDLRIFWQEEDMWSGLAASKIGSLAFTSTAAGKLSAKLAVGGTSYAFADNNGWDGKTTLDNGRVGVTNVFESVINFTVGGKKVVCTNRLTVAACAETLEDWESYDTPMTVALSLNVLSPDKKSVFTNLVYAGAAHRDNLALKSSKFDTLAELADWSGYYTVALAPCDQPDYMKGIGYLTLTVDLKGKAKVSAVLADGTTKFSASSSLAYVSESGSGERVALLPLYYGKGQLVFGGWLRLKLLADGTPIVDSDGEDLFWANASTTSTYDGTAGFFTDIEPVGGYYDTVFNLQRYYLDYAFKVDEIDTWDLPEELLGDNAEYVCYPGLYGDYLTLLGSNITMDKQIKAMRTDDKKLVDWENTVNPSALTMTFKRATGLYNGQFEMWAGNDSSGCETKQVKLGTFKHQGVLLLSCDENASELSFDDAVMPGFWNFTVSLKEEGSTKKRSFTGSLPFMIVPEEVIHDWSEELPRTEGTSIEE